MVDFMLVGFERLGMWLIRTESDFLTANGLLAVLGFPSEASNDQFAHLDQQFQRVSRVAEEHSLLYTGP